MSSLYLLFALHTGLQEFIYVCLCREALTLSIHLWASPIGHEGKCVPDPKSIGYFMQPREQIGPPAHPM